MFELLLLFPIPIPEFDTAFVVGRGGEKLLLLLFITVTVFNERAAEVDNEFVGFIIILPPLLLLLPGEDDNPKDKEEDDEGDATSFKLVANSIGSGGFVSNEATLFDGFVPTGVAKRILSEDDDDEEEEDDKPNERGLLFIGLEEEDSILEFQRRYNTRNTSTN